MKKREIFLVSLVLLFISFYFDAGKEVSGYEEVCCAKIDFWSVMNYPIPGREVCLLVSSGADARHNTRGRHFHEASPAENYVVLIQYFLTVDFIPLSN